MKQATKEVRLDGYEVVIERVVMGGWTWRATDSMGREIVDPLSGVFMGKENAEKEAVRYLEGVERGDFREKINGFQLQARVRERET